MSRADPPISRGDLMKNYFENAITYGNMRRALRKCCRGVRWKDSVVGYELHAPQNTHKLIKSLKNGTYKISPYQHFTIFEPKKREIVATRIADRQVQMALSEAGLYDDIVEHFIYDNCACQKGKGTDFALKRLKVHMLRHFREYGKEGWVLRCDVYHFFPETRHDVAKESVGKLIDDGRVRQMVFNIIDSFDGDKGIGLGSQISQLTELAVLNDLDHYIKEKLKIKRYIRYMDDFLLIHPDKEYLKYCWKEIEKKLTEKGLRLNEKTLMHPLRQGINFLQWRFVLTETGGVRMYMSGKKAGRERRRLKKLVAGEASGWLAPGTADNSETAWEANAARGDAYYKRIRMRKYLEKLKGEIQNGNDAGETAESPARCESGESRSCEGGGKRGLYRHDGRHRNSY